MTHTLLRSLACIALVSLASPGAASAQAETDEAADGSETDEASGPEDPVEATWAARREYHRQLRSVDLSELSSAATSLSLGAYSLSRDEPFARGLGGATLVGGGVHLISGIVYTIRSQRGMNPSRAPDSFREGDPLARELDEAEHRSDLFVAFLMSDTSVISGGISTALAGIARDKPLVQGIGLGIASQGVVTLILDLLHQDQGRRYLSTLRGLDARLSVLPTPGGSAWVASVGWQR